MRSLAYGALVCWAFAARFVSQLLGAANMAVVQATGACALCESARPETVDKKEAR